MNMMWKSEKGTKKRSFTDRLKNSLQEWKDSGAQRKKHMVRAGTALACIVAFTTTYALILPAITLDRTPQCGQEEHIHTEDCYAIVGLAEGATQTSAAGTADVAELSADGLPVADLLSADVPAANGSGSETNAFAAAMRQAGLDEFVIRNLISDTTLADSLAAESRHGESAAENAGHSAGAVADAANASDADDAAGAVGTVRNGSTTNPADASDAHPAEGRRVLICGLEEHHHSRECYTANDTDADASGDVLTGVSSADPADSTEAETGNLTDPAADTRDAADDSDETGSAGSPAADGDLAAASDDADRIDGDRSDNENGDNNLSGSEAPEALHDIDPADSAASDTMDPAANGTPDDTNPAADNASDNTGAADGRVTDDADSSNGNAPAGTNPAGSDASVDVDPADGNASDDTDHVSHAASTTADLSATGDLTADGQSENAMAGSGSLHGNGGASSYNQESSAADATLSGDSDRPEDTSVPEALKNGQKKYNFLIRVRDAIANFVSTGWRRTAEVSGTAISAEYAKGVLPETALMKVHTVDPEPYSDLIAEVTGKENTRIKAFDLSFRDGSEEVEPDGTVKVTFKADFIDEKTTPQVIHITDVGHAEIIPADVTDGKITLTADSFSVYAISYTVDFSYGDYHWSLEGGSSIKLSELFNILGILADVQDVTNVIFSDPDLVKVEKAGLLGTDLLSGGDWELTSLRPFGTEELLTVTFQDGTVLNIPVTDDQEESTWKVNINLLDYNGSDPATQEELALISGKTYAIVATVSNKQTKEVLGYRVQGAAFENGQSSTTCEIGLGAFKPLGIADYDGKLVDINGPTFAYDDSIHSIAIRLYEGSEDIDRYQYKNYREITSLPDHANGYEFLSPNGNVPDNEMKSTTLKMKRAYDKQFNIRLNIDPAGLEITESDKYYVLVTVDHETTQTTYAYAPVTISAGQTSVDIPVTTWYDQNGNLLPNEKFTGNETVNVELYTTNKDGSGNKQTFNSLNEIKNNQVKVLVGEGGSVNTYNVYYGGMQTPVSDDDAKMTYYFSTIDFHAPSGTISKGDLDRLLDDATDFGYYTERYIGHSGDIEATIGADYLDTTFEADFAYSSANLAVNRLKVLKIYTDDQGRPVQKQVTIRLKQNGSVIAEKTGTTNDSGQLELEFDGLNPGEYDITEVIDGQEEISGSGSASISDTKYNINFSIDKAHFADNKNVNYFGSLGPNMDVGKLKTMLEKASRVDVVILTDTQETKNRIDEVKNSHNYGSKKIDVIVNGTEPYKKYDIKSDMVRLRQLSDDLAVAESSDTIRVINVKASELGTEGLSLDDDGRYIVVNVTMDKDEFAPHILLDGKLLDSDYGQSGDSNSSKALFNLRSTSGERYAGLVNTNKNGAGIILAPDANAHILGAPFGGTIITYQVNRSGNELHSNNPNQIQTLNAVIQNVIGEPKTGILQLSKQFADNTKDKVTYFTFKVKLKNMDSSKIKNVSFPATGLKTGSTVTFDENGEALVLVRAGNSVAIANLPGGTTYSVEEMITPETAHFQLDHIEDSNGTIEAGGTKDVKVFNITLPLNDGFVAHKTINGKTPTLEQKYSFKLDQYEDGKWTNIQSQQNTGSEIKFAKVEFKEAGTYYYKIYEDIATVTDLKPDKTVYIVKVEVTGEADNLQSKTTYYEVKDNGISTVTGVNYGTLNESNVEKVTTASFDNKDKITVKKVWANGNTGGNTEIQYTLYRTTTKPEYVDVKVTYPEMKAGADGKAAAGTSEKTYKVMKGSELTLLLDHVWWDDSVNYEITSDVSSVSFSKDGSAKDVTFNYVRYSETTYKAIVPTDTTTNTINITVNYGNNADLYQYMAPIMEVKPPVGEVVEGYEKVALTGGNGQGTWLTGINGLDEKDGSDNPYYYYVYEESLNVDVGENIQRFETTYSVVDKSAVDGEELTINNRIRPAYAWVEVTKDWPETSDEKDSDMASATIVLYRRLKGSSDTPEWYAIKEIRKSSTSPSGQAWTFGWYVLDNNYEYFVQETTLTRADGGSENLTDTNGFAPSGWSWGMPVYSQQGRSLEVLTSPISNGQVNMYYKVNTDNGGTVTISNKKRETRLDKIWTNAVDGKIEVNGVTYNLTDLEVTVKLRMYADGKIVNVGNEQEYLGSFYDNWKTVFANKVMDGTAETKPATAYGPKCYESDPWVYIWEGLPDRGIVDGKLVVYTYAAEEISVKTKSGTDLTQYFTKKSSAPGFYNIYINNTAEDNDTPKTGITVEKKWFRGETEVTGSQNGSVTFDLYRTTEELSHGSSSRSGNEGSEEQKTISITNNSSSWLTLTTGNEIKYKVGDTIRFTYTALNAGDYANTQVHDSNWSLIFEGDNDSAKKEVNQSVTNGISIEKVIAADIGTLVIEGGADSNAKYTLAIENASSGGTKSGTAILSREELAALSAEKVNSTSISISSPTWIYTSGNTLLMYDSQTGDEWHYFVVENTPTGYVDTYEINGNTLTIKNTLSETVDIEATKKWLNADGTDMQDGPIDKRVTFDLYQSVNNEDPTKVDGKSIVLDGESDTNGEASAWKARWSNLPTVDANDNLITYSVKESKVEKTSEGGTTWTDVTNQYVIGTWNAENKTITNRPTEFEFTKIWRLNGEKLGWQKEITVTLNAYTTTTPNTPALRNGTQYTLTATGSNPEGWTVTSNDTEKTYTFKITGLQAVDTNGDELYYYVQESDLTGFATSYATKEGNSIINGDKATNGQMIVNTQEGGYELPSTGGIGTRFFTIFGSMLIVLSGAMLMVRRRQKRS